MLNPDGTWSQVNDSHLLLSPLGCLTERWIQPYPIPAVRTRHLAMVVRYETLTSTCYTGPARGLSAGHASN